MIFYFFALNLRLKKCNRLIIVKPTIMFDNDLPHSDMKNKKEFCKKNELHSIVTYFLNPDKM